MRFRNNMVSPPTSMRGVGLIEVLIAILILAIGMLGIAAMQAMTLRNSQGAFERSTASIQMYSILDSMRSNRASALAGAYDTGDDPEDLMCQISPATTLAQADRNRWLSELKNQLGGDPNEAEVNGTCGGISCDDANCTITVQWKAERGSAETQTLVTSTLL